MEIFHAQNFHSLEVLHHVEVVVHIGMASHAQRDVASDEVDFAA